MSRMLENKKYYFLIEATKSCQLSLPARWLYSFLVFRTAMSKPASVACMVRNLGICNRAVKGYLGELREASLLAEDHGYFLASEPSSECWQWFVRKGHSEPLPWCQRFASYAVYVPSPHQGLPLSHSALLSLVWSLKHGSGWITIRPSALATMLFPEMQRASAKRQVNRAAKNLRDKGLLDSRWNVTVEPEHHHYWRDADHLVNPRSRSDVGLESLRQFVVGCLDGYSCQFYGNFVEFGIHLQVCEQAMQRAGYSQRQIINYWDEVMFEPGYCNKQCRLVEAFAKGFLTVFKLAEEMTAENRVQKGYKGISLGLLRTLSRYELLTVKDLAKGKNSNGECHLKYYQPDYERLRAAIKSAA